MGVKSESEVAQSCRTPSDPMDCSLPGSSIRGIFQARVLEWGAITFSEYSCYLEQSCVYDAQRILKKYSYLKILLLKKYLKKLNE